jgi:hypothetical protein
MKVTRQILLPMRNVSDNAMLSLRTENVLYIMTEFLLYIVLIVCRLASDLTKYTPRLTEKNQLINVTVGNY